MPLERPGGVASVVRAMMAALREGVRMSLEVPSADDAARLIPDRALLAIGASGGPMAPPRRRPS
jgi:hypothetical protein